MSNRRSVLIVEDSREEIEIYKDLFRNKSYNLVTLFYRDYLTELPSEKFELVIIDGLQGGWRDVSDRINARRKVIISGKESTVHKARRLGLEGISKDDRTEFVEALE